MAISYITSDGTIRHDLTGDTFGVPSISQATADAIALKPVGLIANIDGSLNKWSGTIWEKQLKDSDVLEPDLDQFIEGSDGRYRISKLHVTPPSAIVDFTTWGKKGTTVLPVYDTFSFNEASIIEANADQLKTWVIVGSFNAVPAIISSPPAFLNITGSILTGYANLNRLVFELVMINAVPKVNLVITQWANGNADPNPPVAVDPDLLAFYEMNEDVADYNTLFDSSSYGHDALYGEVGISPTRIAGVVGNQLLHNSDIAGSGFTVAHNADMDFSDGITVMGWVTLTTANLTQSCGIISKDAGVLGFSFFTEPTALFRFHLNQAQLGSGTGSRVRSTTAATADTPIHACATWDGVNTRMYINGVLENTTPYAVALDQGTDPLNIAQTSISFKAGNRLDEARVYKRALSGAEILAIYNDENPV